MTTGTGVIWTTTSSHPQALSVLVQQLGPAFASKLLVSRLALWRVSVAALREVQGSWLLLSIELTELLGAFFLSHCGPIVNGNNNDDTDELIQDEAMAALTILLKCCDDTVLLWRLSLAQEAVQQTTMWASV